MKRVLIANRGEIALRIIRTCRAMGIETVAVYSEADERSPVREQADEAYPLTGRSAKDTYLQIPELLRVARESGADAVHPGYGFLAESPELSAAVRDAGLIFVGPTPEVMRLAGNKDNARKLAAKLGIPVPAGFDEAGADIDTLEAAGKNIGFPLLVKAVAGGGGRGMRLVSQEGDLRGALERASQEALAFFGDGRLILEQFLSPARHIEVQLVGDAHGNVVHLFERDCSLQRRYQKVIEESPARNLPAKLASRLHSSAIEIGRAIKLVGVATAEFLVPKKKNASELFFLEVNPRIQVEHPVTEMVTGLDIVELQLRVARGERLPVKQEDIFLAGSAIEARVCAEVPAEGFRPSAGTLTAVDFPTLPNFRVDHALAPGCEVSTEYDSLMAKVIAHGEDAREAASLLREALAGTLVAGVDTNLWFLRSLLGSSEFLDDVPDTGYLDRSLERISLPAPSEVEHILRTAAAAHALALLGPALTSPLPFFRSAGSFAPVKLRLVARCDALRAERIISVEVLGHVELEGRVGARLRIDGQELTGSALFQFEQGTGYEVHARERSTDVFALEKRAYDRWLLETEQYVESFPVSVAREMTTRPQAAKGDHGSEIRAPLPGKLLSVQVSEGQSVDEGETLVVVESMKMEHSVRAPYSGSVTEVRASAGSAVKEGEILVVLSRRPG